jgi:hypothetical protein
MYKSSYKKYINKKKYTKRKKYRLRKRTVKYAGGSVFYNLNQVGSILQGNPYGLTSPLPFIQKY